MSEIPKAELSRQEKFVITFVLVTDVVMIAVILAMVVIGVFELSIAGIVLLAMVPFAIVVPLVLTIIFKSQAQKRYERAKEVHDFAEENGFEFTHVVQNIKDSLDSNVEFPKRHGFVRNRVDKEVSGGTFTMLDHQYTVGSQNNRRVIRESIGIYHSPGLNLPIFFMRPEQFGDGVLKFFKGDDINFDDYPEFSKKYNLRGDDEASLRSFFKPELIESFQQEDGVCAQSTGDTLVYYKHNTLVGKADMVQFMSRLAKLVGQML